MEPEFELSPLIERLLDQKEVRMGNISGENCTAISRTVVMQNDGKFDTFYAQGHKPVDGVVTEWDGICDIHLASPYSDPTSGVMRVDPKQLLNILYHHFLNMSVHESVDNEDSLLAARYEKVYQNLSESLYALKSTDDEFKETYGDVEVEKEDPKKENAEDPK